MSSKHLPDIWAVRAALSLLAEEPPLALGDCRLAWWLLQSEDDKLCRGGVLRFMLLTALERLRPLGAMSPSEPRWWPYLALFYEYVNGRQRADVQRDMALGESTYTRAKRQGVKRLVDLLPYVVRDMGYVWPDEPISVARKPIAVQLIYPHGRLERLPRRGSPAWRALRASRD